MDEPKMPAPQMMHSEPMEPVPKRHAAAGAGAGVAPKKERIDVDGEDAQSGKKPVKKEAPVRLILMVLSVLHQDVAEAQLVCSQK